MSAINISEAIEKTSRMLAEQPEKARSKNVPATARFLDGLRCEVTGPNGETLHTDMPLAMGGLHDARVPRRADAALIRGQSPIQIGL